MGHPRPLFYLFSSFQTHYKFYSKDVCENKDVCEKMSIQYTVPGFELIFICFRLFKPIANFSIKKYVKKCPSSIRCQDLNSRPLEHDSPPITTKPGLTKNFCKVLNRTFGTRWERGSTYYKATWARCSVTRKNCQMSIKVAQKWFQ